MWLQDLAAFAQMAREGKESGEGLSGLGMKDRWMRICVW